MLYLTALTYPHIKKTALQTKVSHPYSKLKSNKTTPQQSESSLPGLPHPGLTTLQVVLYSIFLIPVRKDKKMTSHQWDIGLMDVSKPLAVSPPDISRRFWCNTGICARSNGSS